MAREGGFTLLEVLVAAAIAALALGVLFQGAAGGVRAARISAHVQEATSRAKSRMAVLERGGPVLEADNSGDDGGGFRWRTRVAQVARGRGVALYDLGVAITWATDGGQRQVALQSRRIAPAPPEPP